MRYLMLGRDLPTTVDDMVALRRMRAARRLPLEEYLEFLARLGSPEPATLRLRRGPAGPPFRLAPPGAEVAESTSRHGGPRGRDDSPSP